MRVDIVQIAPDPIKRITQGQSSQVVKSGDQTVALGDLEADCAEKLPHRLTMAAPQVLITPPHRAQRSRSVPNNLISPTRPLPTPPPAPLRLQMSHAVLALTRGAPACVLNSMFPGS